MSRQRHSSIDDGLSEISVENSGADAVAEVATLSADTATDQVIDACVSDDANLLRFLCEHSHMLDVDRRDPGGDAPVHYAVSCASLDCFRVLIEHGASADALCSDGSNSLHIAAQHGLCEFIEPLLKHAVSLDSQMPNGLRPIEIAISQQHGKFAELLIAHRCDVNRCNRFTRFTPLRNALDAGMLEIFKTLLSAGARPIVAPHSNDDHSAEEAVGSSIIIVAVRTKSVHFLDAISEHWSMHNRGCVWNEREEGFPLFFNALYQEDTAMLEYFSENGCNFRATDDAGATAFLVSCFEAKLPVVELFLEACCGRGRLASNATVADCANFQMSDGYSGLHAAVEDEQLGLLRLLCNYSFSSLKAKNAPTRKGHSRLRWCLNINPTLSTTGETPLHFAAQKNAPKLVATLLQAGALPNLLSTRKLSPLHMVTARSSAHDTVQSLLLAKSDATLRGFQDVSPLRLAVRLDKTRCVSAMVNAISEELTQSKAPRYANRRDFIMGEVINCLLCRYFLSKPKLRDVGRLLRSTVEENASEMPDAAREGLIVQIDATFHESKTSPVKWNGASSGKEWDEKFGKPTISFDSSSRASTPVTSPHVTQKKVAEPPRDNREDQSAKKIQLRKSRASKRNKSVRSFFAQLGGKRKPRRVQRPQPPALPVAAANASADDDDDSESLSGAISRARQVRELHRLAEQKSRSRITLMTCVQCRWDVDCLQQQSVFQNLASFFDIRAALRLSFVCKQWSEWLTIGSRAANEVWKYWAAETQSILSNFERGKLWQHIVLSEHPSRSKEAYFSMRASVKKARENFVKRQEVKDIERKLARCRNELQALIVQMHQPGASGSLSEGDQRRWVFLETTEKQFCQRIEQLRKDISALGQDSGDVDGELSHNAHGGHSPLQRVKSREVSDFAMIAADASRTYQPFDFGSDFDIVALDEMRRAGTLQPPSEDMPLGKAEAVDAVQSLLDVFVSQHESIGYCQGMNFICAMFLRTMREHEAYCVFVTIMRRSPTKMGRMFSRGLVYFKQCIEILQRGILGVLMPALALQLTTQRIEMSMFASSWIMTVFSTFQVFNWEQVCDIWDTFLSDGWVPLMQVIAGLLHTIQKRVEQEEGTLEELSVHHMVGKLQWLDVPSLSVPDLLEAGEQAVGVCKSSITAFEKEFLAGAKSFKAV